MEEIARRRRGKKAMGRESRGDETSAGRRLSASAGVSVSAVNGILGQVSMPNRAA